MVDDRTKTYCAMLMTGVCDLPARIAALEAQNAGLLDQVLELENLRDALEAQLAERVNLSELIKPLEGYDTNQSGYTHRKGWNDAIMHVMDLTRAPKVTEARLLDAVASAIRNSEFVFGDERLTFKELMESAFGEDGQYAANAANIIVPQLAYRTLTAAQGAGK